MRCLAIRVSLSSLFAIQASWMGSQKNLAQLNGLLGLLPFLPAKKARNLVVLTLRGRRCFRTRFPSSRS